MSRTEIPEDTDTHVLTRTTNRIDPAFTKPTQSYVLLNVDRRMSFITENSLEFSRKDKRRPRFSFFNSIVKEHEKGPKSQIVSAADIRQEPKKTLPGLYQDLPISSNERSAKAVNPAAKRQHRRLDGRVIGPQTQSCQHQ